MAAHFVDTTPNRNFVQTNPHRVRGAPVYLSPTLNFGDLHIRWDWKDGENSHINWKGAVDFDEAFRDVEGAQQVAVAHYDQNEIVHMNSHNQVVLQWTLRRYVVFFTFFSKTTGTRVPPVFAFEPIGRFQALDLCEDLLVAAAARY